MDGRALQTLAPLRPAVLAVTLQCHPEPRRRAHSAGPLTPHCATGLWVQNTRVHAGPCLGVTHPDATPSVVGLQPKHRGALTSPHPQSKDSSISSLELPALTASRVTLGPTSDFSQASLAPPDSELICTVGLCATKQTFHLELFTVVSESEKQTGAKDNRKQSVTE